MHKVLESVGLGFGLALMLISWSYFIMGAFSDVALSDEEFRTAALIALGFIMVQLADKGAKEG